MEYLLSLQKGFQSMDILLLETFLFMSQLVEALSYKPEGSGFDSR